MKTALLTIARQHKNGNLTFCTYKIDLGCTGILESYYNFNALPSEYENLKNDYLTELEIEVINYTLAHNIIYSALGYAEDFGFKPHNSFTSITQYFLEEDTEAIPLIEVPCGIDGKPAVISGSFDSKIAENQIISQLEKAVGSGNFTIISDQDDLEDFELEDQNNPEELAREFLTLYDNFASMSRDDFIRYYYLSNQLYGKLTDDPELEDYYDELSFLLDINLKDSHVSNEMLGIPDDDTNDYDDLRKLFAEIFIMSLNIDGKLKKKWKIYKAKAPNLPSTCFLELLALQMEADQSGLYDKIIEYYQQFPDYKLIRILYLSNLISTEYVDDDDAAWEEIDEIDNYYRQKEKLHEIELFVYVMLLIYVYFDDENPSKINALHAIVDELGIHELMKVFLQTLILTKKAILVKDILDGENEIDESDEEPY